MRDVMISFLGPLKPVSAPSGRHTGWGFDWLQGPKVVFLQYANRGEAIKCRKAMVQAEGAFIVNQSALLRGIAKALSEAYGAEKQV
jgi:hypothetical protein